MIREVGESIGRTVLEGIGRASSRVQERRALPVDLLESDDAFLVVFDAPGASAGDVRVELTGSTLEVDVDRFRTVHEGHEMRFPGRGRSLHGEIDLPAGADVVAEDADATVTQRGTLEVVIPKEVADGGGDDTPVDSGGDDAPDDSSGDDTPDDSEDGDAPNANEDGDTPNADRSPSEGA